MIGRRVWSVAWALLLCLIVAAPGLALVQSEPEVESGQVFTLGEVIVSGENQTVNLATTVTEVTAEDIKARGAQTVAEALEQLPGVDVATGGKGQSYVNIRGFDQSDLKVLIDGVPVYEQYFRSLDLSEIPVDAVAKITVTKGASSVLYGANTMGGVINIITKKAGPKPTAEVTASWGDYNTENYTFNTGATVGQFNYWLTYSYRDSDGYRLSDDFDADPLFFGEHTVDGNDFVEDGGKRDGSAYIKRTISTKVGWEPDKNTSLYLTFDYHNNVKGVPTSTWTFSDWKQWHVNLVGEKRFNDWLRVKARGFYVDHEDVLWDTDLNSPGRHWFLASAYDNYSVGGELQTFMDFGRWSFLKVGVNFVRDNCQQTEIPDVGDPWEDAGEFESDTYTVAVEDEIKITDWLSFVAGTSFDYYDPREAGDAEVPDHSDAFSPQAGVVVTLSESTQLHGSIGKKTRFPHLKELYSEMAGGNPALKPQKTLSYEIGVTHAFTDAISGSLAFFYNDVEDLISRERINGERVYVNIGEARMQGVEASVSADITDNFWAGLNYTFLSTKDKEADQEMTGRPRHRVNVDMRYRFNFGLTANVQASYTAQERYTDDDDNLKKGPDFFLLNARVEQKLGKMWGVEGRVFAEVQNITDKFYYESEYLMPGRTWLAGLNFKY
jgi:outer membrane receptor protein involved in Fe transport